MTDDTKHYRLEALASLALKSEASGTKPGWWPYIKSEMTTAGLTEPELLAEIARQRSSTPPASGGT